jgi:hypothetical protein
VILERQEEQRRLTVDQLERQTSAIMQAVHAAAGFGAGVKEAAGWRMYPPLDEREAAEREEAALPDVSTVSSMLGGGKADFDWAEVERLAGQIRAAG